MILRFNPRVCSKALYSNPGICRCVRCRPDLHLPPATGATTGAPVAAVDPELGPSRRADGTPPPSSAPQIDPAPLDTTAAARTPRRECKPGGGLFGELS